jgi:hypothetical protein
MRTRYTGLLAAAVFMARCAGQEAERFPEWQPAPLGWAELWERSPNIVIGDLQNVRPFGVQKVHSLPWPAESVRRIYWCEGAFVTHSVIRGEHPSPGKKFLWGSGFPGCVLRSYEKASVRDRPTTQLWFIRQEKEYVRPVSDMVLRYVFRGTWDAQSSLNSQASFASLLLSPRANGAAEKEFAASFLGMAGEACSLLSKTDCTKQVARLAALGECRP